MSPASYLAAPPRAVAGIVAAVFRAATIPGVWDWAIYAALIVGFLAVAGALAQLAVRALAGWRSLKRLRRGIARELGHLADLGEATADKPAPAPAPAKLDGSLSRLRVALAQVAVLRSAIDEAQDVF